MLTALQIARVLEPAAPEERLGLMRTLLKEAPPQILWPVILDWFPVSEDVWPHHRWLRPMLRRAGSAVPYMSSLARQSLNDLSAEQWVVRGCLSAYQKGLSWSNNYDTADYFARRHSSHGKSGHVYDAMIAKRNIFAVFPSASGISILLDNTQLYGLRRAEREATLRDAQPTFQPESRYYDDNDDRKTAELTIEYDDCLDVSSTTPDWRITERSAPLPPIENMSSRNLAALLSDLDKRLLVATKRREIELLGRRRTRAMAEVEARQRGEKPGRIHAKSEGGGSWGQKKMSTGRPTNASKIVTLPVRARPLLSTIVHDSDQEDEAA